MVNELENRFISGQLRVGIIGLGYVGLPLAVSFAEAGVSVLGFDILAHRVQAVNEGRSYIGDVSSERLAAVRQTERLEATTEKRRLGEPDALCICVPTPLKGNREPDLQYVTREAEEIAAGLRPGQLIVLESTTYPGTTEEVVLPILLRSGLRIGDFYLAYSPERVDPGSQVFTVRNTPKLVGGVDEVSTKLALALYGHVADRVIPVGSPRIAEMAKVYENVFRAVNIALANELAQLCERIGLSVWDVIAAAATKPFGFVPFWPGPGVGGHCIPLDPYYLASKAREHDFHSRFIELAGEINEEMPYYVARRIGDALNTVRKSVNGARILLLGVAYKRDVSDVRESPALRLLKILRDRGAQVSYHDPHVAAAAVNGERMVSVALTTERLQDQDCVVIAVDHQGIAYDAIVEQAPLVFDARGATVHLSGRGNIVYL